MFTLIREAVHARAASVAFRLNHWLGFQHVFCGVARPGAALTSRSAALASRPAPQSGLLRRAAHAYLPARARLAEQDLLKLYVGTIRMRRRCFLHVADRDLDPAMGRRTRNAAGTSGGRMSVKEADAAVLP